MTQEVKPTVVVKKRTRRSPEMIAELILESERSGNAAEYERSNNEWCRRLWRKMLFI